MAQAQAAPRRPAAWRPDPLRALYRLFTSVRFAIGMGLTAACAALLGVIFPQVPDPVRLDPAAYDAWLQTQHGRYGPLTEWMRNAGLFTVFRSLWFNGIFFVLLAAVAVCTFNRFTPAWRSVRRPLKRVNDRYFEKAHARAAVEMPADVAAVERTLRARRYRVELVDERDGTTYLFADRFAWAQLATFLSHASLIVFMAGAIVSKLVGFSTFFQVGEGATQPVFPVVHPNQMQVQNLRSIEGRDPEGRIIDYRTKLVVYQNGQAICQGDITVNGPLNCNGYRFHQSTYTGDGVALRVRDKTTGATVFDEAPVLSRQPAAPSPRLVVRDAGGATLFDDFLVLSPLDDQRSLALVPVEGVQKVVPIFATRTSDTGPWQLDIIHLKDAANPADRDSKTTVAEGGSAHVAGLDFSFPEMRGLPSLVARGIPGIDPIAYMQLVTERDGRLVLDIQNPARPDSPAARLTLEQGQPVSVGDLEYTFEGPRAYTGVLVRRDPGSWLIWVATGLMLVGTVITFYVPRRRLWVKIAPDRTLIAGVAERTAHLSAELRGLLDEAAGKAPAKTPVTA